MAGFRHRDRTGKVPCRPSLGCIVLRWGLSRSRRNAPAAKVLIGAYRPDAAKAMTVTARSTA